MKHVPSDDPIRNRLQAFDNFIKEVHGRKNYLFNLPIEESGASHIVLNGKKMGMYASYSYLGMIGHPRINAAAKEAIDKYGTGTHGVRLLAGSLPLHEELEATIADFFNTEAALTFSSGYMTNVSVISSITTEGDYILSDTYNHASIVDGCRLSRANLIPFNHNDMDDLELKLKNIPIGKSKFIVADAVFSMDGDILNLPKVVELCKNYGAWLMIDEAHSLGVLGETGRGIEEHFGMTDVIDIKMGSLSKTIPSTGGYIAGKKDALLFVRHFGRGYIFSAALTPAQAAAALESFKIIKEEQWRTEKVKENARIFISGLQERGFNTLYAATPIVPIICNSDKHSVATAKAAREEGIYVLPVPSVGGAVPSNLPRLRTTVTAAHEKHEIEDAMDIMHRAGLKTGLLS